MEGWGLADHGSAQQDPGADSKNVTFHFSFFDIFVGFFKGDTPILLVFLGLNISYQLNCVRLHCIACVLHLM